MLKIKKISLFFIIIVSLFSLLPFFKSGLPITHDGQDHVARIANFYASLKEGNIIPRWAEKLNWGYGHPILMFLYPLPSYFASLFHFLGFNFVDSVKAVFVFSFVLSGITMFIWVNSFLGILPGLLAAIFYLFAPYRFIDLYIRGALGEHVAFIFPPLILFFMFKFAKKMDFFSLSWGAISFAFLILSHNAISLMFIPFLLFYAIYLILNTKNKKKVIFGILYMFLLAFLLSAFFWLPALVEGKYTLRDIVTRNEYSGRFVQFKNLIYNRWNFGITGQFSVQIGLVHLLAIFISFFSVICLFRKNRSLFLLYLFIFIYFLLAIFLMLPVSNFIWQRVLILQNFQFPWRFLEIVVFTSSLLTAFSIFCLKKKLKYLIAVIFLVSAIFYASNFWKAKDYLDKPENFYTDIYKSTTDTGESSPVWSVRFMEKAAKNHAEIISGKAFIKEISRTSTKHIYQISVEEEGAVIRENTLYFPGWKILVDGRNTNIEFQDPNNRGVMTFFLNKGKHNVLVKLTETKLREFSDYLSLFSLLFILMITTVKMINFNRKN